MATRIPKALVHPGGELFVVWHPKLKCYSPIICDDEFPTPAEELGIRNTSSLTDLRTLLWAPVRLTTELVLRSDLGPYDSSE